MEKPKVVTETWVMSMAHQDSDGEQYWEVVSKEGFRPFVIHVQNGRLYISIFNGREPVSRRLIVEALSSLCKMLSEQGITPWIRIKSSNRFLIGTAKKAGLKRRIRGKEILEYVEKK